MELFSYLKLNHCKINGKKYATDVKKADVFRQRNTGRIRIELVICCNYSVFIFYSEFITIGNTYSFVIRLHVTVNESMNIHFGSIKLVFVCSVLILYVPVNNF